MKSTTTISLMTTMTLLTEADSLIPTTSSVVTTAMMRTAGILNSAVTVLPSAMVTTVPRGRLKLRRHMDAEICQERHDVARPSDRDRGGTESVLQHQVPADDPGDELAQGGVTVGIRTAGHRHERRELAVAERGEYRGDTGEDERQDHRRAGVLGRNRSGEDEDAGADDGTDTKRGEIHRDRAPV